MACLLMPSLGIEFEPNNIAPLRHITGHQISRPTGLPKSMASCTFPLVIPFTN